MNLFHHKNKYKVEKNFNDIKKNKVEAAALVVSGVD